VLTGVEGISLREKKELRKLRFDMQLAANTIEALQKKREEEERKIQRAQKFGLVTAETEDEKRRLRAVKFGLSSEPKAHMRKVVNK
jgi:hypothetical protein